MPCVHQCLKFTFTLVETNGSWHRIHAFTYFNVDIAIGVEIIIGKTVFVNDFLREVATMNSHVLEYLHETLKKKVF